MRERAAVRRAFGIVFQDPSLDDELTAYENMELHGVLYGVRAKLLRERIELLLGFVGLWDRRNDYVKQFSGGMKRRLEIARAFLHQPRLLFLDEPTLGLDPQTRSHIWEFVRGLSREHEVTVFFTTHAMEEAERVADEITVIDHGRIVAEGTAAALQAAHRQRHAGGRVHRAHRAGHPRGRSEPGRPDAHDAPRLAGPLMRPMLMRPMLMRPMLTRPML